VTRPPRVVTKLPNGDRVSLAAEDAELLVAALWDVSSHSGAVTAIGKIQHRLTSAADDPELDVLPAEAAAIRAALAKVEPSPGPLSRLREMTA
jgi:hypothetical protein